jgi:2-aminobenzoate-CoA ligase
VPLTAHLDTFAHDHLPPREAWPDLLLAPPAPQYPERLNCAAQLLDKALAAGRGPAVAFISEHGRVTYAELGDLVNRIANTLVNTLGLVPGNRVLLRSANNILSAAAWLATLKAGGIAVATMPLLKARELSTIIDRAQVNIALCDYRLAGELEKAMGATPSPPQTLLFDGSSETEQQLERAIATASPDFEAIDTAADDVSLIAFTSGTTGKPKATVHFHRDVLTICDTFSREVLRPREDDVFAGSPPIAFTFGLGALVLFPLRVGATALLLEAAGPEELLYAIEKHQATILMTSPTAYRRLLQMGDLATLKSLRRCVSAGEALPRTVFEEWQKLTGLKIIDGIGSTEMLHIFISSSDEETRAGAIGRPVGGYEARIVDEEMNDLPLGTVGRLAVRGPTGCRYLADPDLQKNLRR